MKVLGISALYHDSAAALIEDGNIIAAAQEERFTRKKHDASHPVNAIQYCLSEGNISLKEVDAVVFYDKPLLKFERLLETYLTFAPRGFRSFKMALPLWIREKLFQKDQILKVLSTFDPDYDWQNKLLFSEHHLSHAASAFYPSPFKKAIILTMDGVGEWTTTSLCVGDGNSIEVLKEIHFPHSLGLLYSAFTYYCGFRVNSGEYKLMGLAPYGEPKYVDLILNHLVDIKEDGSFRLNLDYFDFCTGLRMVNHRFEELFGAPARTQDQTIEQRHMDMAASIQKVTEDIVLKLVQSATLETGIRDVCLAGGVALNCVANGKLVKSGIIDRLWVQPAAGDAGGALGAALAAYYIHFDQPRVVESSDSMKGSYLGPAYAQQEIENELSRAGARFDVFSDEDVFVEKCADLLSSEKGLGWFQGRMEFGPRALGSRSILADARSPHMQKTLNLKVKFRESFRPFAPSVLKEDAQDWFDLQSESPYMQLVAPVADKKLKAVNVTVQGLDKLNVNRSDIPAVTHVDNSARIQTVSSDTNPKYHRLLSVFKQKTGCPVIVNTSFNVRGEPIVSSPGDAFRCFMGTNIDALAIGNCLLLKENQDPALALDYKHRFALD